MVTPLRRFILIHQFGEFFKKFSYPHEVSYIEPEGYSPIPKMPYYVELFCDECGNVGELHHRVPPVRLSDIRFVCKCKLPDGIMVGVRVMAYGLGEIGKEKKELGRTTDFSVLWWDAIESLRGSDFRAREWDL